MSSNDSKSNPKAHHGTHNHIQAGKRGLLLSLIACQQATAKPIASNDSSGYYEDLSKISSGQASRDILAFFVPDNSVASQAVTIQSSTAPKAHLSATREHSLISTASQLLTDYDGLTLQNKIAVRRICRAVTTNTESKTRHPISLSYSVALTHKLVGAIHHG